MTIAYTGQQFVNTDKVGGTATVNVAATVTEDQDGSLGPKPYGTSGIGLQLKFTLYNSSGISPTNVIASCTGGVTQSTAQGPGVATCSFPGLKDGTYILTVDLVNNNYYTANHPDISIQVSDPGTGFVTGGGWITDPGTSPTSTPGSKDNFGFEVKFLKNGGLQGNSLFIYRTTTNLGALGVVGAPNDSRAYNFIVKSNAMTFLNQTVTPAGSTTCTPTTPCSATFSGKSNIQAVDQKTGVAYSIDASLIGNQQYFQVDVIDKTEPGSGSTPPQDSYAIRVWTSAGDFYKAGTVTGILPGSTSNQIVLGGGNIQVHL